MIHCQLQYPEMQFEILQHITWIGINRNKQNKEDYNSNGIPKLQLDLHLIIIFVPCRQQNKELVMPSGIATWHNVVLVLFVCRDQAIDQDGHEDHQVQDQWRLPCSI